MKLRPFYLILLTSYILLACSPSLPSGIMDEDDMTDVLVDFHLAQGMAEAQGENIDVNRYKYIQAVFKKHRITEADRLFFLCFYQFICRILLVFSY